MGGGCDYDGDSLIYDCRQGCQPVESKIHDNKPGRAPKPCEVTAMQDCDHRGARRYARREFSNNTVHYCVQCSRCLKTVKTSRHDGKLFIKHEEIPPGSAIFDWIDPEAVHTGGLF